MKSKRRRHRLKLFSKIKFEILKCPRLAKTLERIFVLLSLSIISSLTGIAALYVYPSINWGAMLISAVLFYYLLLRYTYRYSRKKNHARPLWMDVLIPWGVFSALAGLGFSFITPEEFNLLFLPLRVCEMIGFRSWLSISVMLIVTLVLIMATRFTGRKKRNRKKKNKDKKKNKNKNENKNPKVNLNI